MAALKRGSGDYDAVVIGAGVNGLVCANLLARAKLKVLVLEAQKEIGGAAQQRVIAPAVSVSAAAHLVNGFDPALMRRLRLRRRLSFSARALSHVALAEDGNHLVLSGHRLRDRPQLARHAPSGERTFETFMRAMARITAALRPLFESPVISPGDASSRGVSARIDRALRKLSNDDTALLQALQSGAVASILENRFGVPELEGMLAFLACLGQSQGPRDLGSGHSFLWRMAMERPGGVLQVDHPAGGLGGFVDALADAGISVGVETRTGTTVREIIVQKGRAVGVWLANGERLAVPIIVSSGNPKRTLLELVPEGVFGPGFLRNLRGIHMRGMSAKLNLVLDRAPQFRGLRLQATAGRLFIAPSVSYVDKAHKDALWRGFSTEPAMEIIIPTLFDSGFAPRGSHVLSAIVQYTTYETPKGDVRADFLQRIIGVLERYAPGISNTITAGELLLPQDLETVFGIVGGCWHHGSLTPSQFYNLRPVPGAEGYATPLPGLYLCGGGTHPGGGISGIPGRNAAESVLAHEVTR